MSDREEAMKQHPSYRSRLVADARRQARLEAFYRGLADAECDAGGPLVPESDEVRWERQTAEALEAANSRRLDQLERDAPAGPRPLWVESVKSVVFGLGVFGLIWGASVAGEMHGGWPL